MFLLIGDVQQLVSLLSTWFLLVVLNVLELSLVCLFVM